MCLSALPGPRRLACEGRWVSEIDYSDGKRSSWLTSMGCSNVVISHAPRPRSRRNTFTRVLMRSGGCTPSVWGGAASWPVLSSAPGIRQLPDQLVSLLRARTVPANRQDPSPRGHEGQVMAAQLSADFPASIPRPTETISWTCRTGRRPAGATPPVRRCTTLKYSSTRVASGGLGEDGPEFVAGLDDLAPGAQHRRRVLAGDVHEDLTRPACSASLSTGTA